MKRPAANADKKDDKESDPAMKVPAANADKKDDEKSDLAMKRPAADDDKKHDKRDNETVIGWGQWAEDGDEESQNLSGCEEAPENDEAKDITGARKREVKRVLREEDLKDLEKNNAEPYSREQKRVFDKLLGAIPGGQVVPAVKTQWEQCHNMKAKRIMVNSLVPQNAKFADVVDAAAAQASQAKVFSNNIYIYILYLNI